MDKFNIYHDVAIMETIENILIALEKKVQEINLTIKMTFGNTNLMKQQLRHIISSQEHLSEIKLNIDEVIKATDKNTKFPIIPAALGALLTLIGGTTSGFGVDLTLGAMQHHTNEEDKRKNIRQLCISLQKNIDDTIQICEILQLVANRTFQNKSLMQYLYKKQNFYLYINLVGNTLFIFIFIIFIIFIFYSFILLLRFDFWGSLSILFLSGITALCGFKVAEYVSNNDKKWKILLNKIAHDTHYK